MAAIGKTIVATVATGGVAVPLMPASGVTQGVVYELVIQAVGTGPIYLGPSTVTATGATRGFAIANGASLRLPASGMDLKQLYINSATSTDSVTVLYFESV